MAVAGPAAAAGPVLGLLFCCCADVLISSTFLMPVSWGNQCLAVHDESHMHARAIAKANCQWAVMHVHYILYLIGNMELHRPDTGLYSTCQSQCEYC